MTNAVTENDLSLEQQRAIELCCDLSEPIVSVTGGAGTGKTVVLGKVYDQLAHTHSTVLAAPTGRAAKRITELTKIKAKTIHRLLEFPKPDDPIDDEPAPVNEPRRNSINPLDEQVIIIDESSMLGPTVYGQLMQALRRGSVIRFFGDNNQLPPVEEGIPPFFDILDRRPSVTLSYNFRSGDAIIGNSLRILAGSIPKSNERFTIIYTEDPLRQVLQLVKQERLFMTESHQIIMPTRKGNYGTMRVNPSLQAAFNGLGPSLRLDRLDEREAPMVLRANDKFLWIKNDYQLDVFNGEIGMTESVDEEGGSIDLVTPDRHIHVPPSIRTYSRYHHSYIAYDPRKQIELGYAITTHKSQGSEFNTIVYCMLGSAAFLLGRRNFYTAITRAREHVIVVCDRRAMTLSMRNQ